MRYAIFSDIHAHLGRLEAVLAAMKESDIDRYICLGDIVGYGIHPNECLERIRELNCPTLMGNHDSVASGLEGSDHFNLKAVEAILWTQNQMKEQNKQFLISLPYSYKTKSFLAVHSTPLHPEKWGYVLNRDAAVEAFQHFKEPICFIGHSHVPFFFELDPSGKGEVLQENPIKIKKDHRYLVNVGSVGQPRDNSSKSAFVILDTKQKSITLKRVEYNGPDEMFASLSKKPTC